MADAEMRRKDRHGSNQREYLIEEMLFALESIGCRNQLAIEEVQVHGHCSKLVLFLQRCAFGGIEPAYLHHGVLAEVILSSCFLQLSPGQLNGPLVFPAGCNPNPFVRLQQYLQAGQEGGLAKDTRRRMWWLDIMGTSASFMPRNRQGGSMPALSKPSSTKRMLRQSRLQTLTLGSKKHGSIRRQAPCLAGFFL